MNRFVAFVLGSAVVAFAAKKALATPAVPTGVRMASVEGRDYEVFRSGGGQYEVISRSNPGTFIVLGQTGEIRAVGDSSELTTMRADMQKFPANLFA